MLATILCGRWKDLLCLTLIRIRDGDIASMGGVCPDPDTVVDKCLSSIWAAEKVVQW